MISIEEFCERHDACDDGRDWALANCKTMAGVWATARPDWLVWVATRSGVLDDRTLRLFAVHCARSVEHLLTDQRSRDAIDVAERFARGDATPGELAAAWSAAMGVAMSAAIDVVECAVEFVVRAAARAAMMAAASDATWAKQADWLRQNVVPNFETLGG